MNTDIIINRRLGQKLFVTQFFYDECDLLKQPGVVDPGHLFSNGKRNRSPVMTYSSLFTTFRLTRTSTHLIKFQELKNEGTGITEEFILAFQRGEEVGFTRVFKAFYPALCLFANKYVHNKPIAEDIASDSFLKIWSKRDCFTTVGGLKSYLYKTTYHDCLQWLQQVKKTVQQEPSDIPDKQAEQNTYLENITRVETLREVQTAMNMLPAGCKKIFTKLYIEGKSVKETAEELTLSVSTVKNQKARGLMLLRAKLFPHVITLVLLAHLFF